MEPPKRAPGAESKYRPEYCEMLVEHMAKGFTFTTFCCDIDVTPATIDTWAKKYKEFGNARNSGFAARQKHFEKLLIIKASNMSTPNGKGKNFDTSAITFGLKHCGNDFKDKKEIDITNSDGSFLGNMTEEKRKQIAAALLAEQDD